MHATQVPFAVALDMRTLVGNLSHDCIVAIFGSGASVWNYFVYVITLATCYSLMLLLLWLQSLSSLVLGTGFIC